MNIGREAYERMTHLNKITGANNFPYTTPAASFLQINPFLSDQSNT